MNINYKEAQFVLFPDAAVLPDETKRPHFLSARFSLSVENLVILSIVSIMVMLFSFSLGVERGKRVAVGEKSQYVLDQERPSPVILRTDLDQAKGGVKAPGAKALSDKAKADIAANDAKNKAVAKAVATAVVSKVAKNTSVAEPKAVQAKTGSGFTVQVASYKSQKGAQQEAQTLKQKGFRDVYIVPKGTHIILCVGNFQKKEEASLFGKKLKGRYQDLVVRSL